MDASWTDGGDGVPRDTIDDDRTQTGSHVSKWAANGNASIDNLQYRPKYVALSHVPFKEVNPFAALASLTSHVNQGPLEFGILHDAENSTTGVNLHAREDDFS